MTKRLLSLVLAVMMAVSMCTFCAVAVNEVPADIIEAAGADGVDEGAILTLFDEPVSTTWGTKANVLPEEGYTFKTDGQYGLTLILKFEGTTPGTVFGKLMPQVYTKRTAMQDKVDESGEKVLDADGNVVKEEVVFEETKSPENNGNWVNDVYSTNSIEISGDGIYLYYFPFRNINNEWTNVPSIKDVTKLISFQIFYQYGALGNGRAGKVVADTNMTATCLGVIEGNITAYDVYAYNKLTDEYETKASGVSINGASNSNYAQWKKLPDYSELFGVNFGAEDDEYITGWVKRDGTAVSDTDVAVKIVEPTYAEFNVEDLVEVTFLDADGNKLATVDGLKAQGLLGDVPASPEKASNGVESYAFAAWTVNGEIVADPASYKYTGDTTVIPSYNTYGKVMDSDPVAIGKPEDYTGSMLEILTEQVKVSPDSHGVTIVYKVEGVSETIIADNVYLAMNGGKNGSWQFDDYLYSAGELSANQLDLNNGTYFVYYNQNINGTNGKTPDYVNRFAIFGPVAANYADNSTDLALGYGTGNRTPVNNNENATIQLLAVTSDNLQPTVTFHGTDGEVLGTYTHKYTDVKGNVGFPNNKASGGKSYQTGALITVEDAFAALQASVAEGEPAIELPAKDTGVAEVTYEFDGWMDADGNKLDVLMLSGDVYPSFKVTDLRTKYNVQFKNYDGTVLYETVVPEGETPAYPAELANPEKPSTDDNSFVFDGWTPEIAAMPTTPGADGKTAAETVVYTAKYETVERRYDVTYYAEDGETVLDKDMYIVKGQASTTDVVPTKDADVQYTYTFDKWVDLDGKDVDLTKVTSDLKVKPAFTATVNKYTVYFYNEDKTELGKSTVEYGTAATAPEATKEATEWYTYVFDKWVDKNGDDVDVTNVTGDVFVYAAYTREFISPYPGESWPTWAQDAIEYVLINGIMNGMDGGFKPDTSMSRAMVVTVLYRYVGEPEVEISDDFVNFVDNLDTKSWYYDAVIWGAVNGVVNGRGNGIFDPNGNVTRQEFAAILYRFSADVMGEYMGYGRSSLSAFYDREKIDTWAQTPVKWAFATAEDVDTAGSTAYNKTQYITGAGVMNGKVVFAPKANATRAQVATMLYRYMTGERIKA